MPNRNPLAVGTIPAEAVAIGGATTLALSGYFTDPDGDPLRYAATVSDSTVLTAVVAGGRIALTGIAKGRVTVATTATDTEGLWATQEFPVTVPNRAPVIETGIPPYTLQAGEVATLELSSYFSDPDGDPVIFAATVSDTSVAAVSVSGKALAVAADAKGRVTVATTATDTEGLSGAQTLAVTVPNRGPSAVGAIPADTVAAGKVTTLDLSGYFTDPDGDLTTFAAAVSDSAVAGFSVADAVLAVTAIIRGNAVLTVTAIDTEGLTATQEFNLTVPNRPPLPVGPIQELTIEIGGAATLELPSHFNDPDGDILAFKAAVSDTTVARTSTSGTALTASAVAKGETTVTNVAADPEGLMAVREFAVTVPGRAPLPVGTLPPLRATRGGVTKMDPSRYFTDPDGDTLVFEVASSDLEVAKTWVSRRTVLVRAVGVGKAIVTITARDPDSLTATQQFDMQVSKEPKPNRPPKVVGSIAEQELEEGDIRTLRATTYFSDPDGDNLTFKAGSSDSGVVRTIVSGAEVTLEGVAGGTATITVTARDPDGLAASQDFGVTVSEPPEDNRAPVVVDAIPAKTLEEGDSVRIDATGHFSDPDGDDLVFNAGSSDSGVVTARITDATLTVTAAATGSATVSITAEDPEPLSARLAFDATAEPRSPRVSICSRTPTVWELLLKLTGADSCHSVSSNKLARISHLRLASAGIASLKSGDFDGLSGLTRLTLGSNQLTVLPADVFSGLSSLEVLHLSYNDLGSLPSNVFSGLNSLVELNVSHNGMTELPADVFSGLTSLLYLFLDGNDIAVLPPGIFSDLSSLYILFLYGNDFTTLPSNVFSGLDSLDWLTMEGGALTTLPEGTFSGLASLVKLDLANNRLGTLPSNVLADASGLEELLLSGNELAELPDSLFHGLSSLEALWLHGNDVDPMPVEVSLISVGNGEVKATVSTGAPFAIEIPLIVTNGTIDGDSTVTIPAGSVESATFSVIPGEGGATLDVGTLPDPPKDETFTSYWLETHTAHYGYKLKRSPDLPLTVNEQ